MRIFSSALNTFRSRSAGIALSAITSISLITACQPQSEPPLIHPSNYREGSNFEPAEMIALIDADAELTFTKNRQGWLDLFSSHAWVVEPNGTKPYAGHGFDENTGEKKDERLEMFYDSFMSPTTTQWDIEQYIVAGDTVLIDVLLNTTYNNGVAVVVRNHIVYEYTMENGELKIDHVRGYYETKDVQEQAEAQGTDGLAALAGLSSNILAYQGVQGLSEYLKGTESGVFEAGKQRVNALADAINNNDTAGLAALMVSDETVVEFPVAHQTLSALTFADELATTSITVGEMHSAGYATSFEFVANVNGVEHQGVGIADFNSNRQIKKLRFYWNI